MLRDFPEGTQNASKETELNIARNLLHKEIEALAEEANILGARLQNVLVPQQQGGADKAIYDDRKAPTEAHSEVVLHLTTLIERVRMTRAALHSIRERLEV